MMVYGQCLIPLPTAVEVRVQGKEGWGVKVYQSVFIRLPLTGAQVPITSYTCTQPNIPGFNDHGQCTFSGGLRTCAIKEGARPALLSSSASYSTHGLYAWDSNAFLYPNPFVVLDTPHGWCVGSPARSLPPPQVLLLPTSHTHHPPQPRGLSPHKQLTTPRKS